jgi:hypothetical protein
MRTPNAIFSNRLCTTANKTELEMSVLEKFLDLLDNGDHVWDVGCGACPCSPVNIVQRAQIRKKKITVTGMDPLLEREGSYDSSIELVKAPYQQFVQPRQVDKRNDLLQNLIIDVVAMDVSVLGIHVCGELDHLKSRPISKFYLEKKYTNFEETEFDGYVTDLTFYLRERGFDVHRLGNYSFAASKPRSKGKDIDEYIAQLEKEQWWA